MTVVQPADAVGLLLLLVIGARTLGERVGWRETAAVAGVVLGVTGIVGAEPARSAGRMSPAALVLGLAAVGAAAAGPYVLRRRSGTQGLIVVFGAGFAFAAAAFALNLLAHALASHDWLSLGPVAAVVAAAGLAGTVSEQTALQRRPATQVAPSVFVIELTVPLLLAITVGGEHWDARSLALGGAWLLVLLTSAAALSRTPAVSALLTGAGPARAAGPAGGVPRSSGGNTSASSSRARRRSSAWSSSTTTTRSASSS